ncbi:unnamed protein product [Toxocara canis]|uniref:Titin n=1 Tax=Toxocara canis TaxID=6265 RepID=A0A183VE99_TOXCA|nr:unnamed protein product [Toxocara canis]
MEPPRFARQLGNRIEVNENEPVHFEARIQPASDVKMTVEWYHNGAPLAAAHRSRPMFDFGYVALDILYAYPEDSGTYARNELGEVQSNVELIVNSKKTLCLNPHHPEGALFEENTVLKYFEGLKRVRELEQDRMKPLEYPADRECDNPPNFIGDLSDKELNEHEDIHLASKILVTPANNPTMVVEWFVNGQPLLTGSRVKASNDFGFLTMDIRSAIAEDSGVYTVKATNALGEASRQCRVLVNPHAVVLSPTQHEESLGEIHEIENLNKYGRTEIEDRKPEGPPRFVQSMPGNIGEVEEGHPLHMECQVRPTGDNTLTITWLKDGHSIPTGNLCESSNRYFLKIFHVLAFFVGIVNEAQRDIEMRLVIEKHIEGLESFGLRIFEIIFFGGPEGHRFRTFHDFGFVSLDILDMYAADSVTYTCVAKNALGQAETSLSFTCKAKAAILGQTHYPTSMARIKGIEAPKAPSAEAPELKKEVSQMLVTF